MILENSHRLYEMTLPLVGVQSLVMGVTLSILCVIKQYRRLYNKSGLIFLAIALMALCVINLTEYAIGVQEDMMKKSLTITIFAASIEMFLCFFTYMSLLDKSLVNRKNIICELTLIIIFTAPPLFIQDTNSLLFQVLFGIALTFYILKLAINFIIYRIQLKQTIARIENYHSNESSSLISWINRTFYVTITIGIVSVFAPMGDYQALIIYNLFLFVAFFYIYIEVISNIYIFDGSMAMIERPIENEQQPNECADICSSIYTKPQQPAKEHANDFMNHQRQAIYQQWIERKGYTSPSITVDNIALMLNTNRTKLSTYLNNELEMNYYEWIARLRIEEAKRLLIEEPETPICNIAVRIGIEDKSNFGRAFRRITGISPTRYRNENIN